jgi:hypothetical protein
MQEPTQKPAPGLAWSKNPLAPHPKTVPPDETPTLPNPRGLIHNGASFDDTQSLSGLRKLQDSTKFDKARFSFRLYKR